MQLRLIEQLMNAQIHRAGHGRELCQQVGGETRGWRSNRWPDHLTSMGAGRPKFRIWLTMSAGRK
jgi:hypothetical protein